MSTATNDAAEPLIRPFGKLRKGGKPPGTKSRTVYLPIPLNSRVEAQAALMQMHPQELVGRLLEVVFPESKEPTKSIMDLIHPDLVVFT